LSVGSDFTGDHLGGNDIGERTEADAGDKTQEHCPAVAKTVVNTESDAEKHQVGRITVD
jgi:hypothetical protein